MSTTHIQNLQKMVDIYIEERRSRVATALELRTHNGEGGLWAAEICKLQEQIEGLERAIAHEKGLLISS